MPLSGQQKRFLRGLGHHLSPVVQVGHGGVSPGVLKALDQALEDHELVKLKLSDTIEDRKAAAEELAKGTGGECAQLMGRTVLIYRRRKEKPTIVLPRP